jgi:hypothetical protein
MNIYSNDDSNYFYYISTCVFLFVFLCATRVDDSNS